MWVTAGTFSVTTIKSYVFRGTKESKIKLTN